MIEAGSYLDKNKQKEQKFPQKAIKKRQLKASIKCKIKEYIKAKKKKKKILVQQMQKKETSFSCHLLKNQYTWQVFLNFPKLFLCDFFFLFCFYQSIYFLVKWFSGGPILNPCQIKSCTDNSIFLQTWDASFQGSIVCSHFQYNVLN